MRHLLTLIMSLIISQPILAQYRPDILGEGFEQMTLDLGNNAPATLVRATPRLDNDSAILYLHGFNDYFFQREMAQRFIDRGYNFYALDLHNYGRSLRPNQTPFEVSDISDYFPDIDLALATMRAEGMNSITIMAHSTGGLIASLYCASSDNIAALILNSPFFDMNLDPFTESILLPIVATIGRWFPALVISDDPTTAYFESLHKDHHGEWDYDTTLKFKNSPPITAGWLRAIHNAQTRLQKGLDIKIPILLIYSDKSLVDPEWSTAHQSADTVLDVEDIAHYGATLGNNVTHAIIENGMHDIILSGYDAREHAYKTIFEWLKK